MRSRPRGPVFGHRAVYISFAPNVAMPCGTRNLQGAQPKDCDPSIVAVSIVRATVVALPFRGGISLGQAAPACSKSGTIGL